jgi:endonuclease G
MTIDDATRPLDTEASRPVSYYDGYTGYDPAFLHSAVPLPALTEEQRRNAAKRGGAVPGEDATVLPYTHFSVVVNRVRQLAYYTAVNIDGAQLVALPRDRDRWFFDPRIAESEQIGEELYRRNALDRGHLVRRLDPVWGPEPDRPNGDTFHFTNCSPQHERFNQGSDLWQGLENYILDNADVRERRLTVFTGPVLDEDDPLYKGVRLPLAFWKIVAYDRTDGSLAVAAYLLEQARLVEDLLAAEARFDPGMYRVGLTHLEERTGLDFRHLHDAELPLSSIGLETVADRVLIADDYSNVVL